MPDVRHFRDQKYCSKPVCRKASKKVSHQRWLMSDKGAEYRDPEENLRRVREWRAANPEYWKRKGAVSSDALKEMKNAQVVDNKENNDRLVFPALQDMNNSQNVLLVGLIASLTGCTLQETIAESCHKYVLLGLDILDKGSGSNPKGDEKHDSKTHSVLGKNKKNTSAVQLVGSSSGT